VCIFLLRGCVMTRADRFRGRHVSAGDFRDLRKAGDLSRKQAADVLDVAVRTIQNWETGGARIPWMAYRMLRILMGYALPGKYSNRRFAPFCKAGFDFARDDPSCS